MEQAGRSILDDPIWAALRGAQAGIAEANPRACRFPPAMTALGALRDLSAESFAGLAALQQPGEATALFSTHWTHPPEGWRVVLSAPLPQFVWDGPPPARPGFTPLELGATDAAEMEELARLARPGPFGPRTWELGRYLGVRREGRLLAMAGERLRLPGFTEISAVCTRPGCEGQGLAGGLVAHLIAGILQRGETPFLHTRHDNERAIRLYRRLGFAQRTRLRVVVVSRPAAPDG